MHSVTHLKFLITSHPSDAIDDIQNGQCVECMPVNQIIFDEVETKVSRDVDEVIKTFIYSVSPSLMKSKSSFAQSLRKDDETAWKYLRLRLGDFGITPQMIEGREDSIITWVANATNADPVVVEDRAAPVKPYPSKHSEDGLKKELPLSAFEDNFKGEPNISAKQVHLTEDGPLTSDIEDNVNPNVTEEPDSRTENEGPLLEPQETDKLPSNRAKSPTDSVRSDGKDLPEGRTRPQPKRRSSTRIPFRGQEYDDNKEESTREMK